MKTITVIVGETGNTSVDLAGFHGQGCQKALEDFAGGDKPILVKSKPEFYRAEQEQKVKAGAR